MTATITERFPPMPLEELSSLVRGFENFSRAEKKATIDRLVNVHPILAVDWGGPWKYRRCRKLAAGTFPKFVDDLIWRKGSMADLGRANPAGFQVLYLADRQDTAFAETDVTDDWTVVANFQLQKNKFVRIAPIGELIQIHRTGRGRFFGEHSKAFIDMLNVCSRDEAQSLLMTDAFLHRCLTGSKDYETTSQVALSIFSKLPEVTGVGYLSYKQFGAINFAVRVESFWQSWALASARLAQARRLGLGFYSLEKAHALVAVCADGRLKWESLDDPNVSLELAAPFIGD